MKKIEGPEVDIAKDKIKKLAKFQVKAEREGYNTLRAILKGTDIKYFTGQAWLVKERIKLLTRSK